MKSRLELAVTELGEAKLKNITEPIRVYLLDVRRPAEAKLAPGGAVAPPLPEKPSIAVLAFQNMSGDPEQEYFSDGISEDIITDLSKASELLVIARNSSFTYKPVDLKRVGRELGVRYVRGASARQETASGLPVN